MSFTRLVWYVIATCISFLAAANVGYLLAMPNPQFSVLQTALTAVLFAMIATVCFLSLRRELNLTLLGGLLILDTLTVSSSYFGVKYFESVSLFVFLGSVIVAMYFALHLLGRRESLAKRFMRNQPAPRNPS